MDGTDRRGKREEFLAAALRLFSEKGYEKTTVNDILHHVGASKGAFYHYFESKEDVVETLAEEYVETFAQLAESICDQPDINALEKFNRCVSRVQAFKKSETRGAAELRSALRRDANLMLRQRIVKRARARIAPLYRRIFAEGVREGLFRICNLDELPELLLVVVYELSTSIDELYVSCCGENTAGTEEFLRKLEPKLFFYEDAINRLLGLTEGSVRLQEAYRQRFTNA